MRGVHKKFREERTLTKVVIKMRFQLNYKTLWIIFGSCIVVMLLFGLMPPFNYWTFKAKNLDSSLFSNYGQFISGLLGTLLSLAGFILLFKTLIEQRKQFTKTSFENNFYSLLENHRSILASISDRVFDYTNEESIGSDFFSDLAERISIDFSGESRTFSYSNNGSSNDITLEPICKLSILDPLEKLQKIYSYYFHIYQSDLGHYFRSLYHFVRFILESDVDDDTKKKHIKILRAQLSNYEILVLAYNCLHPFGKKFKPMIDKYELLQNLNFEIGLDEKYHKRIVDPTLLIKKYPHLEQSYKEQLELI